MRALKGLIVIMSLLLNANIIKAQLQKVSLDSDIKGIEWEVKPQKEERSSGREISKAGFVMKSAVSGVVPGTVFTSYVNSGKELEPEYADNIYRVDETFYSQPFWYRTEFVLPTTYRTGQRVWLNFENTNRYADFYFNGEKLSGTKESTKDVSGHMIRTRYDVTRYVKKRGRNAIAVLITDADQKKTRKGDGPYGVACSPSYLSGAGWDWMPYVPGRLAGITGHVYMTITEDVVMEDPWVRTELPTTKKAEVSISTELQNMTKEEKKVELSGVIMPGNISFSKDVELAGNSRQQVTIDKKDLASMVINNPKLWWPNGYGDPNLYTCSLVCKVDGVESDRREIKFGIRKYEYQMIENRVGMPVMTFFVNGKKIYVKGGNWGMSEYLLRCHNEEYEKKILLHKDMNYNMIRLWTGCVTDDEFYDYCDKYGIMVWNDFWLYVAFNDVAEPEAFKANAVDKVKRLRNHASIALWCGANETHPSKELDDYLRMVVKVYDKNDRMYKSCSNQDGLSGSGWWGNQPPKHHFSTSGSNLAFNTPAYPYGIDYGYGMRSEIGTATFPTFESVKEFMPESSWWPLPSDAQLKEDDNTIWNKHFFGKEASNANPINYKNTVNSQYGESASLPEFCEKSQLLNIEVMKGMYEAWNDKMWNDASGMLIWMSHPAYPSFVWQTYDYYYDATGSYWGAKKACEPQHIQWNSLTNSIKVVNTTLEDLIGAKAKAEVYTLEGKKVATYSKKEEVDVASSDVKEAFKLDFDPYNIAKGKIVTSSSEEIGNSSEYVVDGNEGTRWSSEYSDNQWICVDLGQKERIRKVTLKWESAYAKRYRLQMSEDMKTWEDVYEQKSGKGGVETICELQFEGRYLRVMCEERATDFGFSLYEIGAYRNEPENDIEGLHFIKLELTDNKGDVISENLYMRNGDKDMDYTGINSLPACDLECKLERVEKDHGRFVMTMVNKSPTVAAFNRIRLVNKKSGARILPIMMTDNYVTLMPGESKRIGVETLDAEQLKDGAKVLVKQYGKPEKEAINIE